MLALWSVCRLWTERPVPALYILSDFSFPQFEWDGILYFSTIWCSRLKNNQRGQTEFWWQHEWFPPQIAHLKRAVLSNLLPCERKAWTKSAAIMKNWWIKRAIHEPTGGIHKASIKLMHGTRQVMNQVMMQPSARYSCTNSVWDNSLANPRVGPGAFVENGKLNIALALLGAQ